MNLPVNKDSIAISINDEGAVVCLFYGTSLQKSLFVNKHIDHSQNSAITRLFSARTGAMVYIYINTANQTYFTRVIDTLTFYGDKKIAGRILNTELKQFLKTSSVLDGSRSKEGARFLFTACPYSKLIKKWVDFISSHPNPFVGIYFLPLELAAILKAVKKQDNTEKSALPIEILITYHKGGSIRNTYFYKGETIYSEMLSGKNIEKLPAMIGEIINTVATKFNITLSFIKVYTILPEELNGLLEKANFEHEIHLIFSTPGEIIKSDIKYSDTAILTVLNQRPGVSNRIVHDDISTDYRYTLLKGYFNIVAKFIAIIAILFIITNSISIWSIIQQNQKLSAQAALLEQRVEQKKYLKVLKKKEFYNILPTTDIAETIDTYKNILSNFTNPVTVLQIVGKEINVNYNIHCINWSYYSENLLPTLFLPSIHNSRYSHYGYVIELGVSSRNNQSPLSDYYTTIAHLQDKLKVASFKVMPVKDDGTVRMKIVIEVWR